MSKPNRYIEFLKELRGYEQTMVQIAEIMGVNRATICKYRLQSELDGVKYTQCKIGNSIYYAVTNMDRVAELIENEEK